MESTSFTRQTDYIESLKFALHSGITVARFLQKLFQKAVQKAYDFFLFLQFWNLWLFG